MKVDQWTAPLVLAPLWVLAAQGPLNAQCGTWSPAVNLSNATGRFAVDSNLALDSAGHVHLVYQNFLDSSGQNYYVTSASGSWSTPQLLGSMSGKGSAPKIVYTPQDEMLHAFFGRNTLYYRARPATGGAWSPAEQVSVAPNTGFIQNVTVDASGGIYFMYGNLFDNSAPIRNGIYGRYKPLGGPWEPTELIYGNTQDGNWPRGDHIMAIGNTLWVAINVDGRIYYKKKPSTGAWPAGRGTEFHNRGGGLRFAFSTATGEIAGMWTEALPCTDPCENEPWFEIFARYSYNDGASWTAPENISNYVNDIDRTQSAVYDENGNLHVVWEGFCCDHKLRMRYRARVAGLWGPITVLSSLTGGHIPDSIASRGLDLFLTYSNTGTGIGLYDVMFASQTVTQPRIHLNASGFNRTLWVGQGLGDDVFTVANGCAGVLNYTVSTGAPWLSVTPSGGSSTTGIDTITIGYPGVPDLAADHYTAEISIEGNASNNPQTLAVVVRVQTVTPDLDGDGDVDQEDFGLLQRCFAGAGISPGPECERADLDGDGDVDGADFDLFLRCYSGPATPVDAGCGPWWP